MKENKEKQIKEMPNCENCIHRVVCTFIHEIVHCEEKVKKDGCEHYQPKLPEDSIVISKEEYEHLKAKSTRIPIDKDGNFIEYAVYDTDRVLSKPEYRDYIYEKGSQETAEKYKVAMMLSIQEMQKYLEIDEEQAKILYHHNAEIAKQFSGEVKEK